MATVDATKDALGRNRSPATMPGYHKGRVPRNKGKKLPAEILTPEEIGRLLDSFAYTTKIGRRNRAVVQLMYRAEAKIGQIIQLQRRHYDAESGVLVLPGQQGGKDREVRLDLVARRDLENWIETWRKLGVAQIDPLFCTVEGRRGAPIGAPYIRGVLAQRARMLDIDKRVTPEGLRKSRAAHREGEVGRFEASLAEYIGAEAFRYRYASAFLKWSDAHQLLEMEPVRHATSIGHLCREAIQEFSDRLVFLYRLGPFETSKTKDKIRAVFEAQPDTSPTVRRSIEALVAYWCTVSDLAQRQEHNSAKDGDALVADDSRRIVFQTMLVMREIDLALKFVERSR